MLRTSTFGSLIGMVEKNHANTSLLSATVRLFSTILMTSNALNRRSRLAMVCIPSFFRQTPVWRFHLARASWYQPERSYLALFSSEGGGPVRSGWEKPASSRVAKVMPIEPGTKKPPWRYLVPSQGGKIDSWYLHGRKNPVKRIADGRLDAGCSRLEFRGGLKG